jgi:hypothetical protein
MSLAFALLPTELPTELPSKLPSEMLLMFIPQP